MRIFHRCDKYVRILHFCEGLARIFTSVIHTHGMCDKFIKKSICNAFIFTAVYLPKHNTVLWKEKCWGDIRLYLRRLGIGRTRRWMSRLNRNLFYPSVKHEKIGECRGTTLYSFSNKCESNLNAEWGGGGGGGGFQVSWVPMLEQRIAKQTLNSVLKISKTGTLFTVFPTKVPLFTIFS